MGGSRVRAAGRAPGCATLDHTEHLVEHAGTGIVRVGHVERARADGSNDISRAILSASASVARPSAQDALVAAVERDDEVVAREVGVRELARAVAGAVVAAAARERRWCACRRARRRASRRCRRSSRRRGRPGRRHPRTSGTRRPPSATGRCCPCTRRRRGRGLHGARSHASIVRARRRLLHSARRRRATPHRPRLGDRGVNRARRRGWIA